MPFAWGAEAGMVNGLGLADAGGKIPSRSDDRDPWGQTARVWLGFDGQGTQMLFEWLWDRKSWLIRALATKKC